MAVKTTIRRNFNYKKRDEMTNEEKLDDEINNSDPLLEKVLNSKKVRYETLNEILPKFPKGKDTVTLYIDIMSVINSIYNPNVVDEIKGFGNREKYLISSNIINMAAHFRKYFASRKGMYTNIVFFYSTKVAKNETSLYPDYKLDYYDKHVTGSNLDYIELNKLIQSNLDLCKVIGDYLPHIYFIDTEEVNPFIIPYYYIATQLDNEVGIIYSNDKLQALNCISNMKKDVYLLRCSYSTAELYSQSNLMETYTKEETFLSPVLLPYLYAIMGVKKYNISGLKNIGEKKSVKLLERLINDNFISNTSYKNINVFLNDIKNVDYISPEQFNIIERNLKLIQPRSIFDSLTESQKIKILDMKDLQDINELNKINDEYYDFYPIQLEELLIGEDYESV